MRDDYQRAARAALLAWDVDAVAVELVSVSENIAFRVHDRRGASYVLRLHRPWYHTLDELISEQTWTAALRRAGVDVPVVVPARTGEGFVDVDVGGERRYAGLLEWVDGTTLWQVIEDRADPEFLFASFERLGAVMAAIHDQAVAWDVPPEFERHALDAHGLMGEHPFWGRFWEAPVLGDGHRRRLAALRNRVYAILSSDERLAIEGSYSLIHADLHPSNVIVHGPHLHVIDFDDAGFGWHAYDFAVALYHFRDHARFDAIRDALIAGYRRVRAVADDVVALVPLFLLIRSLASIGWIAARPELPHGDRATWLMRHVEAAADDVLRGFD